MMEIDLSRERACELAKLMDSQQYEHLEWLMTAMIERNHVKMETADEREILILQGDCKRLRKLLEIKKFLLQSVRHNGVTQAAD